MNKIYNIKEVSELFNITTNKVRFYEKKGLIKPKRDPINNYRSFSENDLIKLQTILMYRVLNLPIEDINDIFKDDCKDTVLNHFYKQWEVINNEIHKMKLIKDALEKIMDNLYESKNEEYEESIVNIIREMNSLYKIKNEWKDKWNFDGWANSYDESVKKDYGSLKIYKNYDTILTSVFEKAIKDKPKASEILEIGIGTGNLAKNFLANDYNIIGLDQSREMLNVAKEKFPQLKLRLGDFMKIPFENKNFDIIVSTYAFHHLNNEEKKVAINEMIRVLKDNGKIVIGDLMFENEEEKQKILKTLTIEQIDEIEDEFYSNVDFLRNEFTKYNKTLTSLKIDEFNFMIEVN